MCQKALIIASVAVALLTIIVASAGAADDGLYLVFFSSENTLYRMPLNHGLQDPEVWYRCLTPIHTIFQNRSGSRVYVVPLVLDEKKSAKRVGASLLQLDPQNKPNMKEMTIPTLQELDEGVGTSLDDKIMVLGSHDSSPDGFLYGFFVVLQVDNWHVLFRSKPTYGVWWPQGDRIFYVPRSVAPSHVESCRLDGGGVRTEWDYTFLNERKARHEADSTDLSYLVYQVGPRVQVYHAFPGRTGSALSLVTDVEGKYLGSTDDKIFLRDPKNRLCVAPMNDSGKVTILSTLNDADEKLFSIYENNMMDADGNIFGNPHVGGMDEISRVYPTPDGAKVLFLNDQGERYPLEMRFFDVKTREWSNRITMDKGGVEGDENRLLILSAATSSKN